LSAPIDPVVSPTLVLIVDASEDCRSRRRSLGATAWIVLEELVVRAVAVEGELRVQVPTRELAVTLGLNKDTVTQALARLRATNTIRRTKRGATGASVFSIHLPPHFITQRSPTNAPEAATPSAVSHPPAEGAPRRRRGRAGRTLDGTAQQLSLLE
jgi:hypothetical protein